MIITKLIGGLGNQMFQYAVARRLALVNNDALKLDITGYQSYSLRQYCLNQLNIVEQIASSEEISDLKSRNYFREKYFHFDPEILKLGCNVYLDGYWQSAKYFRDISAVIRREFTVRTPLVGLNLEWAEEIGKCHSVAVHIRRGDYVTNPATNHFHGVCQVDYYRNAMNTIIQNVPRARFFIFSDDPLWARQYIGQGLSCFYIANNDAEHGFEDLRLMSFCKDHIIANSTFSWWGAWLAEYSKKTVFAPRQWFNHNTYDTQDLIQDDWRLI